MKTEEMQKIKSDIILEAEMGVLGTLLIIENFQIENLALSPEDFKSECHQKIFAAILNVYKNFGGNISPVFVYKELVDNNWVHEDIRNNPQSYLMGLMDKASSCTSGIFSFAKTLKENSYVEKIKKETEFAISLLNSTKPNFPLASFVFEKIDKIIETANIATYTKENLHIQRIDELLTLEQSLKESNLLGYALTRKDNKDFLPVEKDLDGIQPGLYILGAQTNVGKTSFVANIAFHLIESNPDLRCLYFSLDDSYQILMTRFRAIMGFSTPDFSPGHRQEFEEKNIAINDFKKKCSPEKEEKETAINMAFVQYFVQKRLEIYDIGDTPTIQDIERIIKKTAKNSKFFVVIDGLYNASINQESFGKREENIERANKFKALVDVYKFPMICTAELRKKNSDKISIDDIMETSKFGYNANLVWLLYNESEEQNPNNECTFLTLDYAKNKLTNFKGKHRVRYFRNYAKMFVDWPKPISNPDEKWPKPKKF
jgi:replicative DNA helicase